MKSNSTLPKMILHALLLLLMTSCVTSIDLVDVARDLADRGRGPLPESEWNAAGVWRRVADNPATYIPKDYPVGGPRDDGHGSWVVDKRDGKRVFVPNVKVGIYEPMVLMGEAHKVTNWPKRATFETSPGIVVLP